MYSLIENKVTTPKIGHLLQDIFHLSPASRKTQQIQTSEPLVAVVTPKTPKTIAKNTKKPGPAFKTMSKCEKKPVPVKKKI